MLAELDRAMLESNAQGVEANVQDAQRIIADWSAVAERCRVPIELIHGTEDSCTNITYSRAFAADFPDRMTLTEITGGGFYTLFSHTDAVTSRMVAATQR